MIQTTSELLASQSVDIQRQAASSTVSVEALQAAFANIYRAMDAVDAYKAEALGAMSTTIGSLETEIDKAQSYLARVRQSEARSEATDLDLDS
jgi:uncharacterized protein YaaN involved in tellurite resistance